MPRKPISRENSAAQSPLDPVMLGLVQHVAAYERLAVRAARTRSIPDVRRALLAHPLVGEWEMAVSLPDLLGIDIGAPR